MQRRTFLKYTSATLLAGYLPRATFAQQAAEFTIYGAPALPSLVIAAAVQQGELRKQHPLQLKLWRTPDQLRAGVASGEFKVMMSPSNVGVNLRHQGQNIGMINILTNGLTQLISKKPLTELGSLSGKKLLMPFKNDMPDIVFKALLKQLNVDENKIEITYTATPIEAVELFLSKPFDAVFLPEPMASACLLKGRKMNIELHKSLNMLKLWAEAFQTKPIIPQAGIIANVDFYQTYQAQFELLHQDLRTSLNWIKENPQAAAKMGSEYFPAQVPAIAMSLSNANLTVTKGSEIKEEILKFYEILMRYNPKLLGGRLPDETFFLC